MSNKLTRRVVITGAGFSAPAQLPIQNRIITKMTEKPEYDFLSGRLPLESRKFLDAYITVGLFLLNNYGKNDYHMLDSEYRDLCLSRYIREYLEIVKPAIMNDARDSEKIINNFKNIIPSPDDEYTSIYSLRNKIRIAIKQENISVNLEDVFTSFDKSFSSSEYVHKYSYAKMDEIRYSIMRLFSFYFSKSVMEHTYDMQDYVSFLTYIKKRRSKRPITIITTNWDTLLEQYFQKNDMDYCYGFLFPYTTEDFTDSLSDNSLLLLKIHGSANWLKCLQCGAISVYRDNNAASSLFEDLRHERCYLCGAEEDLYGPSLQPEIITPTMMKSLSNRLYSNIWGGASSELREATHIIFAGYSLSIADFDFRYMLQKSVPESAIIDVVLYKDADPNQTQNESLKELLPEKRYRDAFPKNIINFYYDGFGNYFRDQ